MRIYTVVGRILLTALAVILPIGLLYWFVIRPWHLRWGATDAEVEKPLPGDDLVPHPRQAATRRRYLPLALDQAQIEIMEKIREVFDPNRILNPAKIFP